MQTFWRIFNFFSELFNIKKTTLLKNYSENIDEQEAEEKP